MICDPSLSQELFRRAAQVRVITFDIDGVFTNGRIVYDTREEEIKLFDAHDGFGIKLAHHAGLQTAVISARESKAIRHRMRELHVENLYLGRFDKLNAFKALSEDLGMDREQYCFVGDDMPDIPVLEQVGFPVAVNNAMVEVKATARCSTRKAGGRGAIREVIEFVLHAQGRLNEVQESWFASLPRG